MQIKKFSNQEIIQAIKDKFGSIEEFAKALGVSTQAVYSRINNQTWKFLKELAGYGIVLRKNDGIDRDANTMAHSELLDIKKELEENRKLLSITLERIKNLEEQNSKLRSENSSLIQINQALERKIKGL